MPPRRALLGLALAPPALAQEAVAWPDRPVRLVVPFPPGTTPDTIGRAVALHLSRQWPQPCVVENRPGAGGNLGTEAVARATDQHTLGVTINGPLATAPALFPNLGFAPMRDLALVSLLARGGQLLVVHPDLPARDLTGFIGHVRDNPGKVAFGSVGSGSGGHLAMVDLVARAGLDAARDLLHVPYRGFPPAVVDLIAGRIQAMVLIGAGILPQLRAGQVRALATTAATRLPQAPEVPTLAEAGFPWAESYAWIGLIAPAATPAARVQTLASLARDGLTESATRATLEAVGFEIVASESGVFRAFVEAETARWGGLVRRLGIVPEA